MAWITTSWDDGHPLDFRVAELLAEHKLPGTFYVPRHAPTATMTPARVRELGAHFEIGAHTLHHVDLTRVPGPRARQEILASKSWVEDLTGRPCTMFCPPKGRYGPRHLHMAREAGFAGVRTVELLSVDRPRAAAGLSIVPTTLQAFPHRLRVYARNLARRAALRNLWLYIRHGRTTDWPRLARSLLDVVLARGGVFHLWGHSWEIEAAGQWQRLEEVLRYAGRWASQAPALTNGQLCRSAPIGAAAARGPRNDAEVSIHER